MQETTTIWRNGYVSHETNLQAGLKFQALIYFTC